MWPLKVGQCYKTVIPLVKNGLLFNRAFGKTGNDWTLPIHDKTDIQLLDIPQLPVPDKTDI